MIFYHQSKPDKRLTIIKCQAKRQIHEATLCFTKKYFNSDILKLEKLINRDLSHWLD